MLSIKALAAPEGDMPAITLQQVKKCLEIELELIGNGEPVEPPDSNDRLLVFLAMGPLGELEAKGQQVGPDGLHDVENVLAVVDVSLWSGHFLVAQCIQKYFEEAIPTDEYGGVMPDWPIDPHILVEAEEEAWELHCALNIDEWANDARAQIETKQVSPS